MAAYETLNLGVEVRPLLPVQFRKHGSHDQLTHGNWAHGIAENSGGRVDVHLSGSPTSLALQYRSNKPLSDSIVTTGYSYYPAKERKRAEDWWDDWDNSARMSRAAVEIEGGDTNSFGHDTARDAMDFQAAQVLMRTVLRGERWNTLYRGVADEKGKVLATLKVGDEFDHPLAAFTPTEIIGVQHGGIRNGVDIGGADTPRILFKVNAVRGWGIGDNYPPYEVVTGGRFRIKSITPNKMYQRKNRWGKDEVVSTRTTVVELDWLGNFDPDSREFSKADSAPKINWVLFEAMIGKLPNQIRKDDPTSSDVHVLSIMGKPRPKAGKKKCGDDCDCHDCSKVKKHGQHDQQSHGNWASFSRYRPGPDHHKLVKEALTSWKGDPNHIQNAWSGKSQFNPDKAMAAALLWEIENKGRPNPVPLYRGSIHSAKGGIRGYSEDPKNAAGWQQSQSGKIRGHRFSGEVSRLEVGEARGIRISDYSFSPGKILDLNEREWIIDAREWTTAKHANHDQQSHGNWAHGDVGPHHDIGYRGMVINTGSTNQPTYEDVVRSFKDSNPGEWWSNSMATAAGYSAAGGRVVVTPIGTSMQVPLPRGQHSVVLHGKHTFGHLQPEGNHPDVDVVHFWSKEGQGTDRIEIEKISWWNQQSRKWVELSRSGPVYKHGQHDQSSHGNWAHGRKIHSKKPHKDTEHISPTEASRSELSKLIKDNPQRKGEPDFEYVSRIVSNLDPETKHEAVYRLREQYPKAGFVANAAAKWRKDKGLPEPQIDISKLKADRHKADEVARYFETTKDQSHDPAVKRAYADFIKQNAEMYDYITKSKSQGGLGIRVIFSRDTTKEPYNSAKEQYLDVAKNRRIVIQSGLGGKHPLMSLQQYDRFRAVHDIFGHVAVGGGFDRHGEYQAWVSHMSMYKGPGRDAMSSEYHGVNSALWAGRPGTPGTGKAVLLPRRYRRRLFDRRGRMVSKAIGFFKVSTYDDNTELSTYDDNPELHHKPEADTHTDDALDELLAQLPITEEIVIKLERNIWHGETRIEDDATGMVDAEIELDEMAEPEPGYHQSTEQRVPAFMPIDPMEKHAQHDQASHGNWAIANDADSAFGSKVISATDKTTGKKIGTVQYRVNNDTLELEYIQVVNTHQRKGLASKLFESIPNRPEKVKLIAPSSKGLKWWRGYNTKRLEKHAQHNQEDHGNWASGSSSSTISDEELLDRLLERKDGFTVDPNTGADVKSGYVVAISNSLSDIIPMSKFDAKSLRTYLDKIRANRQKNPNIKMGGWYDSANDEFVLDHVEVYPNNIRGRQRAIYLGRQRNQQAIWHIDEMEEINTGGSGRDEELVKMLPVFKHGQHDQTSHGNWASGFEHIGAHVDEAAEYWQDGNSDSLQAAAREVWGGKGNAGKINRERAIVLMRAIEKSPPVPQRIWRGYEALGVSPQEEAAKYQVGKTVDFPLVGFTTSNKVARDFAQIRHEEWHRAEGKPATSVIFRIAAGEARALPISKTGNWMYQHEQEVITGGRFRIKKVSRRGNRVTVDLFHEASWQGTVAKHGGSSHDQSTHGNWSTGTSIAGPIDKPSARHLPLNPAGQKIVTDNVVEAARALAQGRRVELKSEHRVSALLDRLQFMTEDAKRKGKDAPTYNLCNVSVKGSNLFCVESKGIARVKMPQLKGKPLPGSKADAMERNVHGEVDLNPLFRKAMEAKGFKVTDESIDPAYLKASQNELNGVKVAGIFDAIENKTLLDERLFISRDDYIVDGHHRWAGLVSWNAQRGKRNKKLKVARVDMSIIDLLHESNQFAREYGIPQAGLSGGFAKTFLPLRFLKHGTHDQSTHGNWATGLSPEDPGYHESIHRSPALYESLEAPESFESFPPEFKELAMKRAKSLGITHELMVKNMEEAFDRGLPEDERWYHNAHEWAADLAVKYGYNVQQVAAITSSMSPLRNWEDNKVATEKVISLIHENKPVTISKEAADEFNRRREASGRTELKIAKPGVLHPATADPVQLAALHPDMPVGAAGTRPVIQAIAIARGADVNSMMNGPKTRSFVNNIANPESDKYVTIDTWMYRAALGDHKMPLALDGKKGQYSLAEFMTPRVDKNGKTKTANTSFLGSPAAKKLGVPPGVGLYPMFVEAVKDGARRRKIKPHEYQARVWSALVRDQ